MKTLTDYGFRPFLTQLQFSKISNMDGVNSSSLKIIGNQKQLTLLQIDYFCTINGVKFDSLHEHEAHCIYKYCKRRFFYNGRWLPFITDEERKHLR